MKRNFFTTLLLGGVLGLFVASCSDNQNPLEQTPEDGPAVVAALFATIIDLGRCMGDDAFAGGLTGGMGKAEDLNCTANDIYLARALPTRYSANEPMGDPQAGDLLTPGEAIPCEAGSTFYVYTAAEVANNAQQRWDIGVWIATDGGIQAITGQCDHFTLTLGKPGVSDFDGDYCGDMAAAKKAGDTVTELDLEWIAVQCEVTKVVGGVGYAEVGACVGWQNSANKGDDARHCPFPPEGGEADWRVATTPETKAKCNCEPLLIPVDPQGTLTIVKETVPEGDDQQFTFTPGGWNSNNDFYLVDGESKISEFLSAGTYTVTETVPVGWDLTNRACVYNDTKDPKAFTPTANGVSVALGTGEHVTCTFTNTKRANITIKKVTDPAEDPPFGSFTFSQDIDGSGNFVLKHYETKLFDHIVPGTAKTVVESDPTPAYDLTDITCVGASLYTGTVATRTLSVTPQPGEDIVCTFTNTARKPKLTLLKTVNNQYGGTATADDFQAKIDGNDVPWDVAQVLEVGVHIASESFTVAGYTAGDWGGDCDAAGNVTLALGDEKTCTITNSDVQPKLKLVKTVVNNFGGTATASDFQAKINGVNVDWDTFYGRNAGTYTASESFTVAGYTAGDWGGDCAANGSVTLAVGDEKTCTITNSDIQPRLKLVKTVNNQYGGTATANDFQAYVSTTAVAWDVWVPLNAGDYVASEDLVQGYEADAAGWTGDCDAAGNVTLSVGQDKTCYITNNDLPAYLTLVKYVEGGTATADDFQAYIDGEPVPWGEPQLVGAGTFVASEDLLAGYTAGDWGGDCAIDGTVTLALGESKTCTITNTYIPPTSYTAWAANGDVPLEIRYVPRGNWATYVEYFETQKTVTLFANQTVVAGTVTFSAPASGMVNITIDLAPGFLYEPGTVIKIQDYETAPSGNPAPGGFDHTFEPGDLITVPANNFYGVHVLVLN